MKHDRDPAMLRAIRAAGGPGRLALELGITQGAVSQWKRVPVEHVLAIERACLGVVRREELRPDIYPPADRLTMAE